jgi:uncharacterized protein (TIGR04551 family)
MRSVAWLSLLAILPTTNVAHADEGAVAEELVTPEIPTAPPITPSIETLKPVMRTKAFESYAAQNPAGTGAGAPAPAFNLITEDQLAAPSTSFPYVEWHGYFRFRADAFSNLDLNTEGTSPILPPVEALLGNSNVQNDPVEVNDENGNKVDLTKYADKDAELLGGANVRLRLRPIFHLTEDVRIHLEMNILDNVVMGSTPDGYDSNNLDLVRTDLPLVGFSGTQEPPNESNSGKTSVAVTQAYGEVKTFIGSLRLGRMASQWGLGILANGGGNYSSVTEQRLSYRGGALAGHSCLDCDYGDYVDRAMFVTRVPGFYLALGWDYNSSGATTQKSIDYFGQAADLSQDDDVTSYVVSLFSRPLQPADVAERNRLLKELRAPAFDYGLYYVYREQGLSSEAGAIEGVSGVDNALLDDTWIARGAQANILDFWFRYTSEPRAMERIRFELEAAAIKGSIENAGPESNTPAKPRDIDQLGVAMELDYSKGAMATGFNAGYASPRTIEKCDPANPAGCSQISAFAVKDEWQISDREPNLTNFRFDRNYFIDMIMFREVIGAVTNAYYINPYFSFDFLAKQNDILGARFDLITATAVDSELTPSGEGFYGVEADAALYYREPRYSADLSFGYYVPGAAFNGKTGRERLDSVVAIYEGRDGFASTYGSDVTAGNAWTVQSKFNWAF